ncbi:magnesium/cobalt transporter CorA [Lederbergia wuyishanensis]|uniref:Magnesium transport protein CorA n=1 Tax=Lederbergia wuyishanensis TaxID=1347903 RepID=A0ABU0D0M7_9BACI|nr:magnesium/cobalt transporter CorA [Lederbergia wuyishanensis]MCJ8006581.1 magnesium/cobalt transporter CorA [Lederbergia wuyishanensis]MDQ0341962.1 magnesium transporter [Lederbergia wuyishanensis]
MIKTFAINKNHEYQLNIGINELLSGDFLWYWVDFDQPTEEELKLLKNPLRFHPLAIEDCINDIQRPKLDYYDEHFFFVAQAIKDESLRREEVNFFLGENYIVTFHLERSTEIDKVWDRIINASTMEHWDPIQVLYHVLDEIVDNYFPIVEKIEDVLNDIDENSNRRPMRLLLQDLYDTRHDLLSIRHVISPMRDLVYRIINSERLKEFRPKMEYFSDIHNHLVKLSEMIEENRELTTDIRDSYLSLNAHQTNRIMQVLTLITTIFMPLTFIAGIYGMNFVNMPELKWKYGYFGTLLVMVILGFGMFVLFKRKGWFK